MDDYIPKFGKPKKILMDHGTQFQSNRLLRVFRKNNIKYTLVSIKHPSANIVERTNKELGRLFGVLIKLKHTEWTSKVDIIQKILNETHNDTTEFTPLKLHLKKKPTRFWEKIFKNTKTELTVETKLIEYQKQKRKLQQNS